MALWLYLAQKTKDPQELAEYLLYRTTTFLGVGPVTFSLMESAAEERNRDEFSGAPFMAVISLSERI